VGGFDPIRDGEIEGSQSRLGGVPDGDLDSLLLLWTGGEKLKCVSRYIFLFSIINKTRDDNRAHGSAAFLQGA